jgi:hypothetical protein
LICVFVFAGAVSNSEGQQTESAVACYDVPVTEGTCDFLRIEWKVVATCVIYQDTFYFGEEEHE